MKNVKNTIGNGFKPEKSLFGVSINYYTVYKFIKKGSEEIKVALVNGRNDRVCDDETVYSFNNLEKFNNWIDEIHNGGDDGRYLHYQDCGLIARAYPVFYGNSEELDNSF